MRRNNFDLLIESLYNELLLEDINNKKLFHISRNNLDCKKIKAAIPSNFFTKNGYEENKTKRVCFAPTIDQCLMGMSQNLTDSEFFIHIPVSNNLKIKKPTTREVPDCNITDEIWILHDVEVKCIGKIKVIRDKGEEGFVFKYGTHEAELYSWEWKWIYKK